MSLKRTYRETIVELYANRYAQGLDIWTGSQLTVSTGFDDEIVFDPTFAFSVIPDDENEDERDPDDEDWDDWDNDEDDLEDEDF